MISNKTKNHILCETGGMFTSPISKARGLMFTKKTNKGYIFILNKPRRIDLHMFFVFYSIDVLFLNTEKRVVELIENFRPFTFYFSKSNVKYVIEIPQNTIQNSKTEIGDTVIF